MEITTFRNGAQAQIDSIVIDQSGKEMGFTRRGSVPNGTPFESTEVLERIR